LEQGATALSYLILFIAVRNPLKNKRKKKKYGVVMTLMTSENKGRFNFRCIPSPFLSGGFCKNERSFHFHGQRNDPTAAAAVTLGIISN
jgi:hypothetical protein